MAPEKFTLERGLVIEGKVTLKDAGPAARVRVIAVGAGHRRDTLGAADTPALGPGVRGGSAETDSAGQYRVAGLDPGMYEVVAVSAGLVATTWATPTFTSAGGRADLELTPAAVAAFRLVDAETGAPLRAFNKVSVGTSDIPATVVMPIPGGTLWTGNGEWNTRGAGDGTLGHVFLIMSKVWPIPESGRGLVFAQVPGYEALDGVPVPLQVPWSGAPGVLHDIPMRPAAGSGMVRARFTASDDRPIAGVRVRLPLAKLGGGWFVTMECVPDAAGEAVFRVPAGDYREFVKDAEAPTWDAFEGRAVSGAESRWHLVARKAYLRVALRAADGARLVPVESVVAIIGSGDEEPVTVIRNMASGSMHVSSKESPAQRMIFVNPRQTAWVDPVLGVDTLQLGPIPPGLFCIRLMTPRCSPVLIRGEAVAGAVMDLEARFAPSADPDWARSKDIRIEGR